MLYHVYTPRTSFSPAGSLAHPGRDRARRARDAARGAETTLHCATDRIAVAVAKADMPPLTPCSRMSQVLCFAAAALFVRVCSIDNGIGARPPRGWRSWNSFPCEDSSATQLSGGDIIDDAAMRAQMHAVLDTSRVLHNGTAISLAELGFNYISMDDGWQQCNCSTHQDVDPSLPTCGQNGTSPIMSFHDQTTGDPIINLHRFPNMKALVVSTTEVVSQVVVGSFEHVGKSLSER